MQEINNESASIDIEPTTVGYYERGEGISEDDVVDRTILKTRQQLIDITL